MHSFCEGAHSVKGKGLYIGRCGGLLMSVPSQGRGGCRLRRAMCDRPSHRDRRGGCGDINEGEGNEGGMVRGPFEAKRGVLRQARGRLCNVKRRLTGRRQRGTHRRTNVQEKRHSLICVGNERGRGMWCAIVWCVVCGPRVYHKGKRPGMSRQAEPGRKCLAR
jgi:hypothetical protein